MSTEESTQNVSQVPVQQVLENGVVRLRPDVYDRRYDIDDDKNIACWCTGCQNWHPRPAPINDKAYRMDRCPGCGKLALYSDPYLDAVKEPRQSPLTAGKENISMTENNKTQSAQPAQYSPDAFVPLSLAAKHGGITEQAIKYHIIAGRFKASPDGSNKVRLGDVVEYCNANSGAIRARQIIGKKGMPRVVVNKAHAIVANDAARITLCAACTKYGIDYDWARSVASSADGEEALQVKRTNGHVLVDPKVLVAAFAEHKTFLENHIDVMALAGQFGVEPLAIRGAALRAGVEVVRHGRKNYIHKAFINRIEKHKDATATKTTVQPTTTKPAPTPVKMQKSGSFTLPAELKKVLPKTKYTMADVETLQPFVDLMGEPARSQFQTILNVIKTFGSVTFEA